MATPLFVTRKFPPSVGGMEVLAESVWQALRSMPGARLIAHGGRNAVVVAWLPWAAARTAVVLARRRADVVVTGDALTFLVIGPLARLGRARTVTMVMGLDLTWRAPGYRWLLRRAMPRADAVVAISTSTATVAAALGVPSGRLTVVHPGVDARPPAAAGRGATMARLGLTEPVALLVTVGRLVPRKGTAWFAAEVLPELATGVHYVVAGDGPERERLVALARHSAGRLHLVGAVSERVKAELLTAADLFVQPNRSTPGDVEGFGLAVVEAALAGTYVVASRIEGLTDAVVDGETGRLLPEDQPVEWVRAIGALVSDPEGLRERGARARAVALGRFGWEQMAGELRRIVAGG